MNESTNSHDEINRRTIAVNKCGFSWYHCLSQNYFQGKQKLGYTKPWLDLLYYMLHVGHGRRRRKEANDF